MDRAGRAEIYNFFCEPERKRHEGKDRQATCSAQRPKCMQDMLIEAARGDAMANVALSPETNATWMG